MIGDNPKSDIKGGNDAGWITILVKTGIFQGKYNDKENPAKYVVNDFKEAFELICYLENFVEFIDPCPRL
jgi:ribonucleotide monophosphatase NagD (HAD superfamily)